MRAIKPIHENEEIFNDYGEIPRADLLRRYGYVTENYAPYDVIELSLKDICLAAGLPNADVESQPKVCKDITKKYISYYSCLLNWLISIQLEFLEEHDVLEDGYVIPRPLNNASLEDILPAELVILLTALSQTPEEFEQRRSKGKLPKPSMDAAQTSLLYKALQSKQAQYATSLAEDTQILQSLPPAQSLEGSSRRLKMAVQVRMGEKEIFQNILAMLDSTAAGSLKRSANGDYDSRNSKAARV